MSNIPAELKYTRSDEWIRAEGDVLVIGITDHAQDALGEIVHIELPEVGAQVSAGDTVCEVESVKAVAEIYAPAAGEIVEINDELEDAAEKVNQDPYGAWLYKLKLADAAPGDLLDADAYAAKIAE